MASRGTRRQWLGWCTAAVAGVVHGFRGFAWYTATVAGVAHGFCGFAWNTAKAARVEHGVSGVSALFCPTVEHGEGSIWVAPAGFRSVRVEHGEGPFHVIPFQPPASSINMGTGTAMQHADTSQCHVHYN